MGYRESEWEISFFLVHLGFWVGRGTGSEEFISTCACGVLEMGEKMDYKQFLTVHMYQGWRTSWNRSSFFYLCICAFHKEEKLDQKHVFTSASWGKTGTEEVIFTSASVLGMEEKLDQKQFALFIRTLKMIYEFYQVKF